MFQPHRYLAQVQQTASQLGVGEVVAVDLELLEVPDLRVHRIQEVQEVQELLQHLQEFLLLPEPPTQ
jgi:hypothetical protein